MSGLCMSGTANTKKKAFTSLLISGFTLLWSFLISHPLHFLCLVFFSPYLPKLLSFLSPLLITTSLLLFALFAIINDNFSTESSKGKVGFLLSAYHAVLPKLQPKIDNEDGDQGFRSEQALEVYKTVFESSMVDDVLEENNPEEKILQAVESSVMKVPHHDRDRSITLHEDLTAYNENVETIKPVILQENKRIEEFLNELVDMSCIVKEKKLEPPPPGTKSDKVVDKQREDSITMNGSEAITGNESNNGRELTSSKTSRLQQQRQTDPKEYFRRQKAKSNIEYIDNGGEYTYGSSRSMDYDLRSYGSMRREKEWKRTLACKLFEERHKNGDGDEGMDLLWETYEMESSAAKANDMKMKKKKKKESKSKVEIQGYADEYDDEEDEDEEEIDRQQLCCLQAFKFSAGKMNMGVGKRNLVRFSKAVKGFGWLQHVGRLRKKVHNGDSF